MAYQVRERDPIFDETTQAIIERRGKELIGIGLVVLAVITAMIVGSYSPEDPGWMSATEGPAQNLLGRTGATIASPLAIILGRGAWAIAAALLIWGVRFVLHRGEERILPRAVFVPIAVALAAIYASTLVPPATWTHSFGLGGLFGDTMLGFVLNFAPVSAGFGLKIMAILSGIGMLALLAFATGFTNDEMSRLIKAMTLGVIMTYEGLRKLTQFGVVQAAKGAKRGAISAADAARSYQDRQSEKHQEQSAWVHDDPQTFSAAPVQEEFHEAEDTFSAPPPLQTSRVIRAEPPVERNDQVETQTFGIPRAPIAHPTTEAQLEHQPQSAPPLEAPKRGGLFARVPGLGKRQADPEPSALVVPTEPQLTLEDAPEGDRISAKIANALRNRSSGPAISLNRNEPPTTSERVAHAAARAKFSRPQPIALDPNMRPEPPVMRGAAPAQDHHLEEDVNVFTDPEPEMAPQPLSLDPTMRAPDAAHLHDPDPLWEPDFGPDMEPDFEANVAGIAPAVDPSQSADFEGLPEAPSAPRMAQPQRAPVPPIPEPKKVVQHPAKKAVQPSTRAKAEAQPSLAFEDKTDMKYELPPLSLLSNPENIERHVLSDEALEENARMLENVLDDYGVKGEIVSVRPGPVVTMYELEPAPGLKASRVIGLADDIARSMSALSARVSTVPGRSVIGIELPNENREMVVLREILSARDFGDSNMKLPLALGKDIGGDSIVANLAKMPHLLIAGTTGSGKSVAINTMILSLLYRLTPEECRMIMIDPKMLELSVYDGIPHLLSPVVTDPKKAVVALKWVVGEMEERYRKMSKMGVRNIDGYNGRVADAQAKNEMFSRTVQTGFDEDTGEPIFETEEFAPEKMPFIVVIVDEMADLMMVAGKEIEACIQRLAQMARASGIHIIMATQRPSVDVITGTIKANFPTRISFQVTGKIDSRTILGEQGAEQLLGMGDMLYMAGGARITRVHGPFVSDEEVEEIVSYLKSYGPPEYVGGVVEGPDDAKAENIDAVLGLNTGGNTGGEDALYDQAVAIVIKDRKCSTSYIQRKLGIGYNKAARLVEQMEDEQLVSPANHVGKREILIPEQ